MYDLLVSESNEVLTFGSNQFGQLGVEKGTGDGERRVENLSGLGHVTHIACGDTFTAVANSGNTFLEILFLNQLGGKIIYFASRLIFFMR